MTTLLLAFALHADSYDERARAASGRAYTAAVERQAALVTANVNRSLAKVARFAATHGGTLGNCTATPLQCFENRCVPRTESSQLVPFAQVDRTRPQNVTRCELALPPNTLCEANPTHYEDQSAITCYAPGQTRPTTYL